MENLAFWRGVPKTAQSRREARSPARVQIWHRKARVRKQGHHRFPRTRLGRFAFLDGAEVAPKDKTVATLVNTRITQRLIGDFGFSAVGRSFDGVRLAFDAGKSNITLLGARPTRGVFQIDALSEVHVDLFY